MSSAAPGQPPSDPDGGLQPYPGDYGRPAGGYAEGLYAEAVDVGAFDQGTEFSRWALARYIVGRVILERVSWSLLVIAASWSCWPCWPRSGCTRPCWACCSSSSRSFVLVLRLLLRVCCTG